MALHHHHHHHFLFITIAAQGHINPARRLASHLVRSVSGVRVTIAIPTSAFRRMFPSSAGGVDDAGDDEEDGLISYTPYDNGSEDGLNPVKLRRAKESLSVLAADLATAGRPITCIVYALFLSMAADVARDIGVPAVLFWIQPAAVFAIYDHFFHGYGDLIAAHKHEPEFPVPLPGLQPPLQIRDIPTFITDSVSSDDPYHLFHLLFKDLFEVLDMEAAAAAASSSSSSKPKILVNTFQELEADVLSGVVEGMEMIPVGPLVSTTDEGSGDLYEEDSRRYMEWLDSKNEGSVVYVSFGSLSKMSKRQVEEIASGLAESGRPYLWVVRKDNNGEGSVVVEAAGEGGMIVEWCSQTRVLSHRAVGCFVTHCGWNSMTESIMGGVPMVMVPQWTDQVTNARLAEGKWRIGVRATVKEGVLEGGELKRCLDMVMGEEGEEIRTRAGMWRDKAREAVDEGGSSIRNLTAFVESIRGSTAEPRR